METDEIVTNSNSCADDGGVQQAQNDRAPDDNVNINNNANQPGDSENLQETSADNVESKEEYMSTNQNEEIQELEALLAEGIEFESYKAFKTTLESYSETSGAYFARTDSFSVERATSLAKQKAQRYNPDILYTHINYSCIYGGKKAKSRSSGIRCASSRKCGCPVRLRLSVTSDGQRLVIKESKLHDHNHDLEEDKMRLRHLDEETEMEIYNLISLHENKRQARLMIRDKLAKETGKEIRMKDICNIEKHMAKKLQKESTTDNGKGNMSDSEENSNSEDDYNDDEDEDDDDVTPDNEHRSPKKVSKVSTLGFSPARPRRQVGEPSRFKDFLTPGGEIKSTPSSADNDTVEKVTRGRGRPRIKTEPASTPTVTGSGRGRKRKHPVEEASPSEPQSKSVPSVSVEDAEALKTKNKLKERKIAIQEELLNLEKKKMKMMEEMMTKLDKILENQEQEKERNQKEIS